MPKNKVVKYIDLFAGLGGTRIGLENSLKKLGIKSECVFTSEIKSHAVSTYQANFIGEKIYGDITKISTDDIPEFDILLAGFPCQPFSSAGARRGFLDTRGTLFFDVERIIKAKKPSGFLLENVEGLRNHDKIDPKKDIGRTLETIIARLEDLGYKVSWEVLDASQYGVPQKRKRIYIVGTKNKIVDLKNIPKTASKINDILEKNLPKSAYLDTGLTKKLLNKYSLSELRGKQIKDKRGGSNNIHSWDIGIKGPISKDQKYVLEELLKQRRRKNWAIEKGIPWSDGMPLTLEEISTFIKKNKNDLKNLLDDLVQKKYLTFELPKKSPDWYKKPGYNIVVGKLSFEISNILDPMALSPTLVATDVTRIAVADDVGLRRLTVREGLRLFGFPESYQLSKVVSYQEAFDLLGNSVSVKAIELVSSRLIKAISP